MAVPDSRTIAQMSFVVIPIWPLGQVNVKWASDDLFSERNGPVPSIKLFGIRLTWRRWRPD